MIKFKNYNRKINSYLFREFERVNISEEDIEPIKNLVGPIRVSIYKGKPKLLVLNKSYNTESRVTQNLKRPCLLYPEQLHIGIRSFCYNYLYFKDLDKMINLIKHFFQTEDIIVMNSYEYLYASPGDFRPLYSDYLTNILQ